VAASAQQVRPVPEQGGEAQEEEEGDELEGLEATTDEPEALRTLPPEGAGVAAIST